MNDKQLLIAAAEANHLDYVVTEDETRLLIRGSDLLRRPWNPLEDDGDAFRLANDLEISVIFGSCKDDAPIVTIKSFYGEAIHCNFPDPYKAARRAVVEMAADIWKQRLEVGV